jgi:hypothetical protein
MHPTRPFRGALALLAALPAAVAAQHADPYGYDPARAWIVDSTIFVPFRVTSTMPLRDARARGLLEDATTLLVLEERGVRLALVTTQMAYHHVAQGDIAGEPWMVSF